MHPVVEHLLARKNKSVPINDWRKIVLVLYGGIMRGVRTAGALMALEELGLRSVFDEIYAYSVEMPNGFYFPSGLMKEGAASYYKGLAGPPFIRNGLILKYIDVNYLVYTMKAVNPLNVKKILEQKTKFFVVRVVNTKTKRREFLEVHDVGEKDFFNSLETSISPPSLSRGPIKIGNGFYADTNIFPHLKEYLGHVFASQATDVLIIYNFYYHRRQKYDDSSRILGGSMC